MSIEFSREILIIIEEKFEILKNKKIIIFGVGGVGSFTCEAIARSGISNITVVDYDQVCITNINRQIIALYSTIGKDKVDVIKDRIEDINKTAKVNNIKKFVTKDNIKDFNLKNYDYVIDAIDNVTAKLSLIEYCFKNKINIISSLGTGNKFDFTKFQITDISKTSVCPLAKVIRYELKKREIYKGVKVLFSTETPSKPFDIKKYNCKENCYCSKKEEDEYKDIDCTNKRSIPGSNSFIPPIAGMMIAGFVINSFLKE
jgi:tRNA A37 threonylcarbamoyladenosine dehydratase